MDLWSSLLNEAWYLFTLHELVMPSGFGVGLRCFRTSHSSSFSISSSQKFIMLDNLQRIVSGQWQTDSRRLSTRLVVAVWSLIVPIERSKYKMVPGHNKRDKEMIQWLTNLTIDPGAKVVVLSRRFGLLNLKWPNWLITDDAKSNQSRNRQTHSLCPITVERWCIVEPLRTCKSWRTPSCLQVHY